MSESPLPLNHPSRSANSVPPSPLQSAGRRYLGRCVSCGIRRTVDEKTGRCLDCAEAR
jgi:hypothetical protein